MPVRLRGPRQYGGALRPVAEFCAESPVDIHGFNQRQVKKSVAAVAAAFPAADAGRKIAANFFKKRVGAAAEAFVFLKNGSQIGYHALFSYAPAPCDGGALC